MKYTFQCTCGDMVSVEADSREGAIEIIQENMTPEMMAEHLSRRHHDEPLPDAGDFQIMLSQAVRPAYIN
jgi:hypothetical protein